MSDWLTKWRDSAQLGLSKQTFNALISTNQAIADLTSDLFNERYQYVLTGRLQTDPLERRFSQYRQMSGGRFLVSLNEIYRSESIIKLKTFLEKNIELTTITSPITDEESIELHDFVQEISREDFNHITISQDAIEVITFLSGYISRSLLKSTDCEECKRALNIDPVTSSYLDDLNKGGLKIPTSSLNNYTQCAFSILDYLEQRILELEIPSKVVTQSILDKLSSEWDDSFVCPEHSSHGRHKVNSIISNCFLKNLARDVSDTRRRDQVREFKRIKITQNN